MTQRDTAGASPVPNDLKLAVKDGLRELRFSLRQRALTLARRIDATSHRLGDLDGPLGQLPRLGEPIGAAARTAAQLIDSADQAALRLLRPHDDYRQMEFRLQPVERFFSSRGAAPSFAHSFTKTHYWAIRHLLRLQGIADAIVHEQAVFHAFRRVADARESLAVPGGGGLAVDGADGADAATDTAADAAADAVLAADVIRALCSATEPSLLRRAATPNDGGASGGDALADAALALRCSASVVLAGPIAAMYPNAQPSRETAAALTLAAEVVGACLPDWQAAMAATAPPAALAAQFAFTLRHV